MPPLSTQNLRAVGADTSLAKFYGNLLGRFSLGKQSVAPRADSVRGDTKPQLKGPHMCCHNGHGAKEVLSALRGVDNSITEKDSAFWHKTLGSQGGGTAKADPVKALAAIDAAWLAATKNNKNWSAMSPQERLDTQGRFRSLREHVEDGQITLTENQVLKLGSYVTKRKVTPRIVRVGTVAAGLLVTMGVVTGSAANAEAAPHVPIAATVHNANDLHTPVGKNGMCATDFTIAKAKRTHKVTWLAKTGNVTTRHLMKEGTKACIFIGTDGATATAPVSADGTLTALPPNFPAKPTAQEISSLGLTRDSKIAPNVRLGQPTGPALVQPELANKIVPVRALGTTVEQVESGTGYISQPIQWVEWEVQGGQGALTYRGATSVGGEQSTQSVSLNPNGSVRILQGIPVGSGDQLERGTQFKMSGTVVPDYGQTSLPSSLTQNWHLKDQRALDVTGSGFTASKHSIWNPSWARADGVADDSYVFLDVNGNMVHSK